MATPQMEDTRFQNAVVFVCGHDKKGAMGIIINKVMSHMFLSDLLTKVGITHKPTVHTTTFPVHYGGPVEIGRGFILHSTEFTCDNTVSITPHIAMTSTLEMLSLMADNKGPFKKLCALGYTGWGAGQLEKEILANAWLNVLAPESLLFETPLDQRWSLALEYLGVCPQFLSPQSGRA